MPVFGYGFGAALVISWDWPLTAGNWIEGNMESVFINASREALLVTVLVSAPAVLAALVVGLLLAVVQALTQIQEQTLGMAAKMAAVFGVLYLMGYWMAGHLSQLAFVIFSEFPNWIH